MGLLFRLLSLVFGVCLGVCMAVPAAGQSGQPAGEIVLPEANGEAPTGLVPAVDDIPVFTVPELVISEAFPSPAAQRKHRRRMRKYAQLEAKVRKVYPLAKECGSLVRKVDREFAGMKKERDRKRYAKRLQKEVFEQYEPVIRKLRLSEGKLLLKLIDRETGHNAYSLIKSYRSGTTAVFWQTVAKIFKADLKANYNAEEEFVIETIIYEIEKGQRAQARAAGVNPGGYGGATRRPGTNRP